MGYIDEEMLKEEICHLLSSAEYKLDVLADCYGHLAGEAKQKAREGYRTDSFESADDFADIFDEVKYYALKQSASRLMCEGIHKLIKLIKYL